MPYEAYCDSKKTKLLKARDATINDVDREFYCKTEGCNSIMTLVNVANSDKAYFRRKPSSAKHVSVFCSADGNFDSTQYDESKFDFYKIAANIMKEPSVSVAGGTGGGTITGGGGKKALSNVHQIYLMCRKYSLYNGIDTTEILADERDYKKYEKGIKGYKIVQCTVYHKVKDEFSYIMNFPSFPFKNCKKHIKLNFETEELFWYYHHKFKSADHKEFIIVFGLWNSDPSLSGYIAECNIVKKRQIHFLKCDG